MREVLAQPDDRVVLHLRFDVDWPVTCAQRCEKNNGAETRVRPRP
jgi:hypothetical protein